MKSVKYQYIECFCPVTHYNSLNPLLVGRNRIDEPYHKIAMACDAIEEHKCDPVECKGFLDAADEVNQNEEWRLKYKKY